MPDAVNPVELIKRAAVGAVEASKPVNVLFGTVASASPLQIRVEQKLTLGEKSLILARQVTDYSLRMTVDHQTDEAAGGSGEGAFDSHRHSYKGLKTFRVHNALKAGEKVLLIRLQGGQKYLVVDRLEASP